MIRIRNFLNRIYRDIKEYGWALIVFVIYYVLIHVIVNAFCPLLVLTGIPCAGCGMTRAFLYLFRGQFSRAMYMNPSVIPVLGFIIYVAFFRYVLGKKVKGLKWCIIGLVAVMLILYGYRMWMYFPDRVPYVYYGDNILAEQLPGYETLIKKVINFF